MNLKENPPQKKNKHLVSLLFLYVALSTLSLFILPLDYITKTYLLSGLKSFANALTHADAGSYLYPIAGVNRLILFFLFITQISSLTDSKNSYKSLFIGTFYGAVLSVILGLLDYYSIMSLSGFRMLDPNVNPLDIQLRLQSTFGHPGWFAEFIIISIPFLLIGFSGWHKTSSWKLFLFAILFLCELALILSKARAVWVAFPHTIFFFWLLFFRTKHDKPISFKIDKKDFIKISFFASITVVVGLIVAYMVLGVKGLPAQDMAKYTNKNIITFEKNEGGKLSGEQKPKSLLIRKFTNPFQSNDIVRQHNLIMKRSNIIESLRSRSGVIWMQGIDVGVESPFFGSGYESYRWHTDILSNIPEFTSARERQLSLDTPHSFFIQLFVSGGLVGLFLWILIVIYVILILLIDFKQEKTYLNIPVILSIVSFHLYGIFQDMQYIPVIWFFILLNIGYALTIGENVLPIRHCRFWKMLLSICIILTVLSGFVYFKYPVSKKISEKYGLWVYATDQNRDNYIGFFSPEKWKTGKYRWSQKEGILVIKGHSIVELSFHASHPDIEKKPVMLNILLNKEPFDKVIFTKEGSITRKYYIPDSSNNIQELLLKVSRTWNPYKNGGSNDNRDLGIAVSEIKFLEEIPADGIGFYSWEQLGGGQITGWPDSLPVKFRWAGMRASMNIGGILKEDIKLFLFSNHPDIKENPVGVKIFGNHGLVWEDIFMESKWKKAVIKRDEIKDSKVLTLQVDRTWNPKSVGISQDGRDLGVAVAIP
ncbi:MAG: O-antigen ligase family protein [Nitrospirae bacterium]|nr:O-antigen ligase family protein [Nitrospirota bacterium]